MDNITAQHFFRGISWYPSINQRARLKLTMTEENVDLSMVGGQHPHVVMVNPQPIISSRRNQLRGMQKCERNAKNIFKCLNMLKLS